MPGLRPGKSTAQTLYTNLFIGLHQMPGLRPEIYCLASIYQNFDGLTPNSWMRGWDLLLRYFLNLIFFCCAYLARFLPPSKSKKQLRLSIARLGQVMIRYRTGFG